jgi:hypothetical protein
MCLSVREKLFRLIEGSDGSPSEANNRPDRYQNSGVVIYHADNVDRRIFNGRHAQLRDRPTFQTGQIEKKQTSP